MVTTNKEIKTKLKVKKKSKKRLILSDQQKEQNLQKKEIRNLLSNIGFIRVPYIDGTEFTYEGRTSEFDDIYYSENIVILTEYTIGNPSDHLINKKIIYDKINDNPRNFIKFLIGNEKFIHLRDVVNDKIIANNYTINQLQIRILYVSKKKISDEHKGLNKNIVFFDYSIVKYFESISKVIKKSAKHEFYDFLQIKFSKIGNNIRQTSTSSTEDFSGHILPEEHSSFKEGYKIVSFYIDAESLLKRAYVLRKDGWKNTDNIGLYQRMFVGTKIRSMRKYLHDERRVFVNNIIVTLPINKIKLLDVNGKEIEIDSDGGFKDGDINTVIPATINIANEPNIIGIVDGQHRTFAYHEGDDIYEETISKLRTVQNLLISGILYPSNEVNEKRIKFEAKLFLEINSNQAGATSQLKQEIEFIMNSFSTISISKFIIKELNKSGPLQDHFEEFWFEKNKLKTASIISFGLKPLVKFEGNDSLFKIWPNTLKENLKRKNDEYELLNEYRNFCVQQIRDIFIGLKFHIESELWNSERSNINSILSVTMINGVINCLRILVYNNHNLNLDYYKSKFIKIKGFNFNLYKSSQYRKMGEDIYERCFK